MLVDVLVESFLIDTSVTSFVVDAEHARFDHQLPQYDGADSDEMAFLGRHGEKMEPSLESPRIALLQLVEIVEVQTRLT